MSPPSQVFNMLLEKRGETVPERKKRLGPKQKEHSAVDVSGGESKF